MDYITIVVIPNGGGVLLTLLASVAAILGFRWCHRRTGNRGFIWLMIAVGIWPLMAIVIECAAGMIALLAQSNIPRGVHYLVARYGLLQLAGTALLVTGAFVTGSGFKGAWHGSDDS